MPSFLHRSYQKELLDRNDIPFEDIKRNMQELNLINQKLGGHKITISGLSSLIRAGNFSKKPISLIEIGCGGGDNLRAVKEWAAQKKIPVTLTGIDINPECISFAKEQKGNQDIFFIQSDYRNVIPDQKPDIIFSSLFCHHFSEEELIFMLHWMRTNSNTGFFINDLHRHPLAYYAIRFITSLFSKSYLVKNDAPLSVLRSFKRKDWIELFKTAGIKNFQCQWRWAFRWLVTCHSDATAY